MQKPRVLIITGPTAVGKTKLGIKCSKLFYGEIISADCVQVYKGLNIGSAKITKDEMEGVPHHLIDIIEPTDRYDVDTFRKEAHNLIIKLNKEGKLPIIVGGTGFYIRALLFPYSLGNAEKSEEIREKYSQIANEKGKEYLFSILQKVDPESAKMLHFNDVKRVIRALEIFELTGKKKSEHTVKLESSYDYTLVALTRDRKKLYEDINKRVELMFEEGLVQEVEDLIKNNNLTKNNQSMEGIGYKEFFDYFKGTKTLEEVKEQIKQNTRNYAKRQITYFKTMPEVNWFETDNKIDHILTFLKTKYN